MEIARCQILGCFFLLFILCFPLSAAQTTDTQSTPQPTMIDGQILFAPLDSFTTYLIDRSGALNHTWSSSYLPGEGVRWLGNGAILRTIKVGTWGGGGLGGGVQIIQWDGTISWDYRYSSSTYLSHHDVRMLPNGDVLLIAWEVKSRQEALNQGRNPSLLNGNVIWPEHIIEVKPTGPTTGTIVWEWHAWDHLIQDYDASKQNYGVVADHPELININYGDTSADWMHCNAIDYNEQLDQILISIHNFDEVWVIDHSTTTEQAAGHTGGRYDHGGDLLYRWGNPQAYDRGTTSNQVFFSQHDAQWIRSGCPGAGDILVFNNGVSRGYSSIDEVTPPIDTSGNYSLDPGSAYGPDSLTWQYVANPPSSFYALHISGAERLTDGDTLICNGETGRFFEVTSDKSIVWQYNSQYPPQGLKEVFKIDFIPPETPPEPGKPDLDCSGSLTWTKVKPGATATGSFTVQNVGDSGSLLNWTVNASALTWGNWTFSPSSGDGLTPENGALTVHVSVVAPAQKSTQFEGYLRVENTNDTSDYDTIPISLATPAINYEVFQGWTPFYFFHILLYRFLSHSGVILT